MKTAESTRALGGRYVVTARIGSGGMGEVLRARDSVLGRIVALKVLPVDLAVQPGLVERFRAEAQAAARVSHPNVVQVHDWGEDDHTYYMVMEYVRGRNLRQILARGPLEPRQAAEVTAQVLAALGAAHEKGLVHRDIKPENILVAVDGTVKVTDFGIARVVEAAGMTGSMLGTIAYAAPEQARGEEVDGRTDLYSTGCVLYELLTGSLPFEGDVVSILHQHLHDTVPPPSRMAPGARQLDHIVWKATVPEMADRYGSAAEMRNELISASAGLPPAPAISGLTDELTSETSAGSLQTVFGQPRKKDRRRFRIVLGLLLAAELALAGFLYRPLAVPELAGLTSAAARQRLETADLDPLIKTAFSDAPKDTVFQTEPAAGAMVFPGGDVTLVVSAGPELTDAPPLTGMPQDQAKQAIEAAGLTLGKVEPRHDRQPAGTVLDQDPKPSRVRRGDPMNLVVSLGPQILPVPNVVGKSFAEAQALLSQNGFDVQRQDVFSDAPAGVVAGQSPNPGQNAEQGTAVKLSVSKGPQPFDMPDFKGKPCSEAKGALTGQGMQVNVRSSGGQAADCGANKVLEQDPLPASKVNKGREATLYVG